MKLEAVGRDAAVVLDVEHYHLKPDLLGTLRGLNPTQIGQIACVWSCEAGLSATADFEQIHVELPTINQKSEDDSWGDIMIRGFFVRWTQTVTSYAKSKSILRRTVFQFIVD